MQVAAVAGHERGVLRCALSCLAITLVLRSGLQE
jgi:hypothetical protein